MDPTSDDRERGEGDLGVDHFDAEQVEARVAELVKRTTPEQRRAITRFVTSAVKGSLRSGVPVREVLAEAARISRAARWN